MIGKLLKKNKYTEDDFLKELLSSSFDLEKMINIQEQLNIDLKNYTYKDLHILHYCCKKDLFQAVMWLLDQGLSTEIENEDKETAIFYSIYSKSSAIIQLLIERKANVNHLNIYRRTALQEAVISASNRIVNYLVEVTTDLNNSDIHGNNLIFDAVANGNKEIIKKIATLPGVNVNKVNEEGITVLEKESVLRSNSLAMYLMELGVNPTILNKSGKNFLFYAVSKGMENFELIQKAVDLEYKINVKSAQETTLLMESLECFINTPEDDTQQRDSHFEMMNALINFGINIDALDNHRENILFKAVRSKNEKLIELFFDRPTININQQNLLGETVLSILTSSGFENFDLIKRCLLKGANPNIKTQTGRTLIENLIDAVLYFHNNKQIDAELEKALNPNGEHFKVLTAVLAASKPDLNQLNSKGEPLFFQTILCQNFKLFKLLRKYDVDLNQKDINGDNIIFRLMDEVKPKTKDQLKIFLEIIKYLINLGVDRNGTNKENQTALYKSFMEENDYVLRLLLSLRADINAVDVQGRTLAHLVVLKNKPLKYLKIISHYNKDLINMADIYGIKPLNYAAFMGKIDLVRYLLENDVIVNNTENKDPKMLKFFEKFHQNVLNLPNYGKTEIDKMNLNILKNTMVKEFNIKE